MYVFYWLNSTKRYHKMKLTIPIRNLTGIYINTYWKVPKMKLANNLQHLNVKCCQAKQLNVTFSFTI